MERMKKINNLTVGIVLVLAMMLALVGVFTTLGSNQSAEPASATGTVNFVPVTDASQITEANIGECTFAEAKQWIYDNWDDVFDGVGEDQSFDFYYYVGDSLNLIIITLERYPNLGVFDTDCNGASEDEIFDNIAFFRSEYGDIVYFCDPSSVSGGGSGGQGTAQYDTNTLAVTLSEDYINENVGGDSYKELDFPTAQELVFSPNFTYKTDSSLYVGANWHPADTQQNRPGMLNIMIRDRAGENAALETLFNKGAELTLTFNGYEQTYGEDTNSNDGYTMDNHVYSSGYGTIIFMHSYNGQDNDDYIMQIVITVAQGGGQQNFPEGIELYVAGVDILAAGTVTTANEGVESGTATVRYDEEDLIVIVNLENFLYSGEGHEGSAIYFKGSEYCNRLAISANGENILACPNNNNAGMIYLATPGANLFLYGSVSGDGALSLNGNYYGIMTANGEKKTSIGAYGNLILRVESNVYAVNMTNDNDSFDVDATAAVTLLGNTKAINGNNLCFRNGGQAWDNPQHDPVALEADKGYNSEDISSYIKIVTTSSQSGQGQGSQQSANKPIALDTTYFFGENIVFSGGEYVYSYVPNDWKYAIQAGTYEVRRPDTYSSGYFFFNEWLTGVSGGTVDVCATFPGTDWNFDSFTGIRCSGGDGSAESPYTFVLITDEPESGDPTPATHTHNDITFTAWESTTSLPSEAGNYYLTADVTLSSTWTAPTGTTNLCLNGHGINLSSYRIIYVTKSGSTLNLYDCGSTVHYYDVDAEGVAENINDTEGDSRLSFIGGYIAGGTGGGGGAIWVENATFNMYGGAILGNRANVGGGVYVSESAGVFNMYGGKIMHNKATRSSNNSDGGGGVYITYGSTFVMYGGEISNNYSAKNGGGVEIYDGNSRFNLFGGEIYANNAAQSGGGVYIANSYITVGLSGNPIVRDNFANSVKDNFYTCGGKLNITGELTSGASVGVTMSSGTGVFTSGWTTNMNGATPADYFSSDNTEYNVSLLQNEAAILAEAPISTHEHDDITFEAWESATSLPNEAGNYYLTSDVTISSSWNVPSGTTNLCLNGHVISAASNVCISVITVKSGSTLNLYDCDTTTHYYYINANTYKQNRASNRDKMYDIGEIAADGPTNSDYVASAKKGTFKGGYITGGTGQGLTSNSNNISGGGFQIYGGGTLNMYGGCVFGNYTSATSSQGNEGGGVYVYQNGVFNMNGGYIIGNQGGNACGGVQNLGTFTMNDGYIGHNTAGDGGWANGGGVGNSGTMTMNGGVIEGNEAGGNGGLRGKCGGAIENNGSLTINGGFIINNFCDNLGGGIYMSSASASLTIGANATITGNYNDETKKADNVYLGQDKMITLGSALTEKNSVGVTLKNGTGVFTSGWSTYMDGEDPADYFISDVEGLGIFLDGGEAAILAEAPIAPHAHDEITFIAWESVTSLPNEAGNYYLTADVAISSSWNVPSGTTNLCLNGFGIKMTSGDKSVITVGSGATLNVYDCGQIVHYFDVHSDGYAININETEGSGRNSFVGGYVTGGQGTDLGDDRVLGGGFFVNGGTLHMFGGTVIGNYMARNFVKGAGVWVGYNGTFIMEEGVAIKYNWSDNVGGGVGVGVIFDSNSVGTFIMNGGEISHNKAAAGGGIMLRTGAVTINGGTISHNVVRDSGGAIDFEYQSYSSLSISGAPVINNNVNYNSEPSNVVLRGNTIPTITIPAELTSGANVRVLVGTGFPPTATSGVFTSGWSTYMDGEDPADYFFSENTDYQVYLLDGEAAILAEDPNVSAVTLGTGLLYVGGVDIVAADNYTVNGTGGGTAVLSEDVDGNSILTLNSYVYEGAGHGSGEGGGIDYRGSKNLIIILNGASSITKANDNGINNSHGIYFHSSGKSLIIDGTGSLTIGFSSSRGGGKSNGIFCEPGSFVMNGGTVVSNAGVGNESAGIYTQNGITFNGGSFTGNGNYTTAYESRGIYSHGTITINGGTVCGTAPLDNGAEARAFDNGTVIINAGTVTAYGKTAFQWPEYDVQCGSDSTWTILAGDDENSATEVSSLTNGMQYVYIVAQIGTPVIEYDLYIAGKRVTSAALSGEGWSYDPNTNTLTLNNFTYEGEGSDDSNFWHFNSVVTYAGADTFYLIIEGTNSITNTKNDYDNVMALFCISDMIIGGEGTLTLNAPNTATNMSMGLCVDGNLLISGGVITANSGASEWRSAGICVFGMRFIQTGGSVIAVADEEAEESYGLHVLGEAQVHNGAPQEFTAVDVRNGITIGAGIKKLVAVGYTSALYTKGTFDFKRDATAWTDANKSADGAAVSAGEYFYDGLKDYKYIDFKGYVSLDTNNKPDINVPGDKDEAEDGDELTVDTDATPVEVKWYYDDDGDGQPDGEPIGEGETYTVKCPDENDPDHDDTGHTIIAVVTQNEDENGDPYPDGEKPTVTTKPVKVEGELSVNSTKWIIKMRAKNALSISADGIIEANEKVVRVYGVTLYKVAILDGVEQDPVSAQPSDIGTNATITVKLTIPDVLIGKNFRILHVHTADDVEFVAFTVDADGLRVTIPDVDRLSDFAFVALASDLIPADPGEQEEQEQGSQSGQNNPVELAPEKQDDPTIDNWTLTPQGQGEQGQGGQDQDQDQGQGQGQSGQEQQKPTVTVALEDCEPQEGVTVEVEVKADVSQEITEADNSVLADRMQSDDEIAIVYEVKLIRITTEDGVEVREEIQPSDIKPGTVVVINMDIPEELRGKPFKVLHVHAEDDITEIPATEYTTSADGKTVTVRVSRLSEFAFLGKKATNGESGSGNNGNGGNGNNGEVSNEGNYNGNFCPGWLSIIFGLIVFALFVVMVILVATNYSYIRKFLCYVGLIASGAVILAAVVIYAVDGCVVSAFGFGVCTIDALLFILYGPGEDEKKVENKPKKTEEHAEAPEEVAAEEEVAATEEAEDKEEGMTLKETLAMAATATRSEKITKAYVRAYLTEKYPDAVELNVRENYTKTGLPLADTHFVKAEDGKDVCFIYVYETEGATMLLLKTKDELGENLAKDYKSVRRSAFPKAKDKWYSVVIDDSLTDEQVNEMIDRTIALYAGTAGKKGLGLKESFSLATAANDHQALTLDKKTVGKILKERHDDVLVNYRGDKTKTGLPLADTHYVVRQDGEECFLYVYEVDGMVMLLAQLADSYVKKLSKTHKNVYKSAFPKSKKHWYTVVIDSTFTQADVDAILDASYAHVKG